MISYKKSKKKLFSKSKNKKRKLNKKSLKKKKGNKQKGGYNKTKCLAGLQEISHENNIRDVVVTDDSLQLYTNTIFKLRPTQDKKTHGNTPYLKQLIDYFYDCISKNSNKGNRPNVHEGLYIEL